MEPKSSLPHLQILSLQIFRNVISFYVEDFLAPRPIPQAGGPPFVDCPRLLIQYIRSYPPYRRPFLHPQPKDAPCRGDRDPLITAYTSTPVFLCDVYGDAVWLGT